MRAVKLQPRRWLDAFAALRLRGWLWLMALCESAGLSDTPFYYWLVRRAAGCHRWRT